MTRNSRQCRPGARVLPRRDILPLVLITAICTLLSAGATDAAVMTFDGEVVGTVYGDDAGDVPGDIVLTEDGIDMSAETMVLGGSSYFTNAEIEAAPPTFDNINVLQLANIAVRFDWPAGRKRGGIEK